MVQLRMWKMELWALLEGLSTGSVTQESNLAVVETEYAHAL